MSDWHQWPARKLVEIELAGTKFFLDLRAWECRDTADFSNRFSLDDIYITDQKILICFDPSTKNLFRGGPLEFEQRKHALKMIRLPGLRKLDPIGYRALQGLLPLSTQEKLLPKKRISRQKRKRL